jgi:hypothetical protein
MDRATDHPGKRKVELMSQTRGFVRTAWLDYRKKVMPPEAPHVQVVESRRAFYAGAEMLMLEILRGLDPGPDASQGDMDLITDIHQELMLFAVAVKEGKA